MTKCTTSTMCLPAVKRRNIKADFDGGNVTSDGGGVLLNLIDQEINLTKRVGKIVNKYDQRQQGKVIHKSEDLIRQRVYGLACGYEDLNDHDELRSDINFQTVVGTDSDLASSPTLCRFENQNLTPEVCRAVSKILVDIFVESFKENPEQLILDFDATDDIVHGNQEGRFFHGYYKHYCFLPLYAFCGDQLLAAYLRPSNIDGAKHTWAILSLLVKRFQTEWPEVEIIFRGDGGFCRWKMLRWCDKNNVKYIVGYTKNPAVERQSAELRTMSKELYDETKHKAKLFGEFDYAAGTWDRERRIIVKAEYNSIGPNTRYTVTNLDGDPEYLYTKIYCARGDMENRIKEQQMDLFADKTSCSEWWANQLRLLLSSMAYVLLERLRAIGLKGTKFARAQAGTIRLKLLKIGAVVKRNTRSIYLHLSSSYPHKELLESLFQALSPG